MTTKKAKQANADAEPRDAHIKLKLRAPDGAVFDVNGPFSNTVAFAVYMLVCEWGDGKTHKVRSKRDVAYEKAAQEFLAASKAFYASVDTKPKKKAS